MEARHLRGGLADPLSARRACQVIFCSAKVNLHLACRRGVHPELHAAVRKQARVAAAVDVGAERLGVHEEITVDGEAHLLIAGGVEVKPVVLEEEGGIHTVRVARVGYDVVEVDDAVKVLVGADPVVEFLAYDVVLRVAAVAVALDLGDGGDEDLDAAPVGIGRDFRPGFLEAAEGLKRAAAAADVVGAFEEDHVLHAFVTEEVTLVAAHRKRAEAAVENAVAAEAEVEHGDIVGARVLEEGTRELVGPAVLSVGGGAAAVGDGVAQDGYCL